MTERFTREPLQTYEECLWRLIGVWDDAIAMTDPGERLPHEALLVCDLFWVSEEQFRADIRRLWNSMFDKHSRFPSHYIRGAG